MLGDAIVARDPRRGEDPGRADADRVHRTEIRPAVAKDERVDEPGCEVLRIVHVRPFRATGPGARACGAGVRSGYTT